MDTFKSYSSALDSPARDGAALSGNDTADLTYMPRALYIGIGGDLRVEMAGGQVLTFANVPGGTILPLRISKLLQTGTTARQILGVW